MERLLLAIALLFFLSSIYITSWQQYGSIRHHPYWLVKIQINESIGWTVGSRNVVWALSALGGGTSRVLSIESPSDSSLPELFPVCEAPRKGLDDAMQTLPPPKLHAYLQEHPHIPKPTIRLLSYLIFLVDWPCRRKRTRAIRIFSNCTTICI